MRSPRGLSPRLWLKVSIDARGKLANGYPAIGQGFDMMTLNDLTLEADAETNYIKENRPTYPQFEAWVAKQPGVKLDKASVHNRLDGMIFVSIRRQGRNFLIYLRPENLSVESVIRLLLRYPSLAVIWLMMPFKLWAWQTRFRVINRIVVTLTKPVDFALIWLNTQNGIMRIYQKAYGGNFLFGDAYMVTDYDTTVSSIVEHSTSSENFMGVSIVSSEADVFASNAGMLNQNEPLRSCAREYLDKHVFTPPVHCLTLDRVKERCDRVFEDWRDDAKRDRMMVIRSVVTRVFILLLAGKLLDFEETKRVTRNYVRSFVELSLFGRYFVFMSDLLGSRQRLRSKVYFPLKEKGVDTMVSDITMFAAMFSVGTMVIRAVEDLRRFDIDYSSLDDREKRRFLIEVVRLFPTVTTVDRIVERETTACVRGREFPLKPGSEIAYPFVCSNRDPKHFPQPETLRLDREHEEYEKVLSWSKGPHSCPAKEISLLVGIAMLDELGSGRDLRSLRIFNPMF